MGRIAISHHGRLARKKVEEELERYRLIVESLSDGVFTFDLKGNVTSANNVVSHYGYEKEEIIGKSLLEFIPEKNWPMISEHLADIAEGKSTQGEVELNTKQGTVIAEFRSSPVKERGKIIGFQSIVRNITEMKKTEKALKESEQKLRDVIENSPDAVVWVDTTGKITLVNRKAFELTAWSEEDLIGKNFMEVEALTQESKEKILEGFIKRLEGIDTSPYEVEVVAKNGEIIPAELSASLIFEGGKIVGTQSIFRDLRERKRAEERLRESEERLRLLIEYAPDGIFSYDSMGRFIDGNRQAEKMTGYKKEELIGKNFFEVGLLPERYIRKSVEVLAMNRSGQKTGPLELELIRKDGSTIPVEVSTFPVEREGKLEVIGIARDITERRRAREERKKMEEGLRESEERFRNLYESIQDPLAVYVGREGRLIDYNKAFKRISGYTDEELKDKTFLYFVHPDDQAMVLEKYRAKYPEEELPLVYEIKAVNKKGETIPLEISVSTYKARGKVIGIEVIHRDIRERKAMERKLQEYAEHLEEMVEERTGELKESQERLLKAERLAVIGHLATMVGHDLRNPLSSIQNACYYLKMKLGASKDETPRKMFEVIDKEVDYTNKIINDLLDFSRVKKPEIKKIDIISSIQDALTQLKFPENIKITTKFSEVPTIDADQDQLRRVFQNIALNGVQAMPDGGELTVSARKNGDFIEVAFTDAGVGIPEENMGKLFTALFTTKAKGVGLGLAICKNLVEAHNGSIEVKSKVGEGSTFTVKLPIRQNKGVKSKHEEGKHFDC